MAFVRNLPNNGARYGTKRKSDNTFYCQPYVAWHDTKPPKNNYCQISKINHLERSMLLRKKLVKIERKKNAKLHSSNNFQKKRKRINRKRRRPISNSNCNKNKKQMSESPKNNLNPSKRRKHSHSSSHKSKKCNDQDRDVMDFLMSQVREHNDNEYSSSD